MVTDDSLGTGLGTTVSWCTVASPVERGFSSVRCPSVSPFEPSLSSFWKAGQLDWASRASKSPRENLEPQILTLTLYIAVSQTYLLFS